jgi:hypothetical protein
MKVIIFLIFVLTNFIYCKTTGWQVFNRVWSIRSNLANIYSEYKDLTINFYNPALLGDIKSQQVGSIYESGLFEDNLFGLFYARPIKNSCFVLGIMNYNVGESELLWIENGEEHSRKVVLQEDFLSLLSYSRPIVEKIRLGINLKFANSKIAEDVSPYACVTDVGVMYLLSKNIVFSSVLNNFGLSGKFLDRVEELPSSFLFDIGYFLSYRNYMFFINGETSYIFNENRVVSLLGLEIARDIVGITISYRVGVEELPFRIGFFVAVRNLMIGYTYIPAKWLNSVHCVYIGIKI